MPTLRLSWKNVAAAVAYDVRLNGESLRSVPAMSGARTWVSLAALPPGDHVVEIVSRSKDGDLSDPSAPIAFSLYGEGRQVPAPVGIEAWQSPTEPWVVDVLVDNVPGASLFYRFFVDGVAVTGDVPADAGTWTTMSLEVGPGGHLISVEASDRIGNRSARSAAVAVQVPARVLETPFVRASYFSASALRVRWDPVADAERYRVFVNNRMVKEVNADEQTLYFHDVIGLAAGTYDCYVQAFARHYGPSPATNVTRVTLI